MNTEKIPFLSDDELATAHAQAVHRYEALRQLLLADKPVTPQLESSRELRDRLAEEFARRESARSGTDL